MWLLNKGRTTISVKLPSDKIIGDKDLEMMLDMDNTSCNKGIKDIKIMLFRRLVVRNKEQEIHEETKNILDKTKNMLDITNLTAQHPVGNEAFQTFTEDS